MDTEATNRESFAYFLGWSMAKVSDGVHSDRASFLMGWTFAKTLGFTKEEYILYMKNIRQRNIKGTTYILENYDTIKRGLQYDR